MEGITRVIDAVNGFLWGPVMLLLLVGTGIVLTVGTKFFQVTKFGHVFRNTFLRLFRRHEKCEEEGALSPLQALSTALAGTIGTGNIVGVAGAIATGGPGAVFWMWVAAFFGMMTKYAEAVLAVKYRQKNEKGEWSGGPMYYITNGLGKKWKWLAVLFALFAAVGSFGIGNMTQVNSIASSLNSAFGVPVLATGLVIAAVVAVVVLGGVKRVGKVTAAIVPFMSALYILGALAVLVCNAQNLPAAFGSIFRGAFQPSSILGGVMGYTISLAITKGMARGVFSNEAGLGSAPIAHAATSEKDPVKQGLYGVFEVFVDTIVVCTLTGLTILSAPGTESFLTGFAGRAAELDGAQLTAQAFGSVFGNGLAQAFIAIAIFFFAFSTIIGWSYYGEKCTEYLLGTKAVLVYKLLFVAALVLGACMKIGLVWDLADMLNGLMAIPNLIALLGLSGVVFKLTKEYVQNRGNFPEKLDKNRNLKG